MDTYTPPRTEVISELVEWWIAARSYAPASARQRRSIMDGFTAAVGDRPPADISPMDVLRWWAGTEHLKPSTRRAYHVTLSSFFAWCRSMDIEAPAALDQIRKPRVPRSLPKVLTADQERRLREHVAGTGLELAVLLMLDMGLRRSEAARAHRADIDAGWMTVRGKGGAVDRIPVPESVARLLPESGRLVPWAAATLHTKVTDAMHAVGIHGHSCHSLRRTFGTNVMAGGASAVDTMRLLRHTNLATTTVYVRSQYDDAA